MDNVKAIFLDMDGTILHENNQASTYQKDVINQLRERKDIKYFWQQDVRMNASTCTSRFCG